MFCFDDNGKKGECLPRVICGKYDHLNFDRQVKEFKLVNAELVIGVNFLKSFGAGIQNTFGGRVTSLESVSQRAWQDVFNKLRRCARDFDVILNVKFDSVNLTVENGSIYKKDENGNKIKKKPRLRTAVIVYGTAVKYI